MANGNLYRVFINLVLAALLALALPVASQAAGTDSDEWNVDLMIYLWMADINGHTPSGGDVEIDFDTIIDNLDFAFMGAVDARKGKWSLMMDPVYMKISGGKGWTEYVPVGQLNIPVEVDAKVKLESWIVNAGVGYNIYKTDRATLDAIAGVRYTNMDVKLGLDITGLMTTHSGMIDISETNWDGFVGVKGQFDLNDKWFVPYRFDIGAGDSDLTWNAVAAVGYRFKWGQLLAGYRYLDYDFSHDNIGKLMEDLTVGGPLLGAQFSF